MYDLLEASSHLASKGNNKLVTGKLTAPPSPTKTFWLHPWTAGSAATTRDKGQLTPRGFWKGCKNWYFLHLVSKITIFSFK